MDISRNKHRRKGEVNIVPLVDVFTALIFFFLLTMQFKNIYAVDITPPTMQSSESADNQLPNILSISKDGKYLFNAKEIDDASLAQKLKDIAKVKLAKIKKLSLQTNK